MPIYEYKCAECGQLIEKMQRISDAPLTVCENCGGKLEKQISRSGFQFKGDGWYVTDYAGKKSGGGGGKTSTSGSTSNADSASKDSSAKETTTKKD